MSAADARHNQRSIARIGTTLHDIFVAVVPAAEDSIKHGSPLTGSPGQPVATDAPRNAGALRDSWVHEFDGPDRATIGTNKDYAEDIETGIGPNGPITLRTSVGGFRSVAHTHAGAGRILDDVTRRFQSRGGGRAQS